jgi:hypothetical protein
VPAVTLALEFASVPIAVLQEGFSAQLGMMWDTEGDPVLRGFEPLKVTRQVGNVSLTIGDEELAGMDVDEIEIEPRPGGVARLSCKVKGECSTMVGPSLWDFLHDEVGVEMVERQLEIVPEADGAELAGAPA